MDEAKNEYVKQWMHKAESDLLSARKLASFPNAILETAFYHCQQSAEKAVKAYLAFRDHPLVKTHDVEELVELAGNYEPRFAEWKETAELLTPYSTAFRYPPETKKPDDEEFQQAERGATGIFKFVCSLLPMESQLTVQNILPDEQAGKSKLHTIYVFLFNENVDVWRPVQAKYIKESVYQIVEQEYDKSVEEWEFAPGEIVFCEPAQLSEGICLVAKRRI